MKWRVHAFALGMRAASLPASANTASDNIAWSAQPGCTAYTGRQIKATGDTTSDPLVKALKVAGTLAATSALTVATKAGSAAAPNPCRRF
jgi:hypothetical protein